MQTHILRPLSETYQKAAELLRQGQVVAMPTETVYGLAGAISSPEGLLRIFEAKERPKFDPLIVHIAPERLLGLESLGEWVDLSAIPATLKEGLNALIKAFWPGPLTLVLPKQNAVPDLITSGLDTVALRYPKHSVAQALIRKTGSPLAAPSANRFGRISPTSTADVFAELEGRIPLILEGGPCELGLESTVLGLEGEELVLLRPGSISLKELASVSGQKVLPAAVHPAEIKAPGMLKNHYAPTTPLYLFQKGELPELPQRERFGLIVFEPPESIPEKAVLRSLSGNLKAAAPALFSNLRQLDNLGLQYILAERPDDSDGLGYAIANRLDKAAIGPISILRDSL